MIRTSISIGVTAMENNGNETTVDQLLSRADKAMYRAKQTGRNRVVSWEDLDQQTT